MALRFREKPYTDQRGKKAADYLSELLDADIDVVTLATALLEIPNEGTLQGTSIGGLKITGISTWYIKENGYYLVYSYHKKRNEVCFLYVFNGDLDKEKNEIKKRIQEVYS